MLHSVTFRLTDGYNILNLLSYIHISLIYQNHRKFAKYSQYCNDTRFPITIFKAFIRFEKYF